MYAGVAALSSYHTRAIATHFYTHDPSDDESESEGERRGCVNRSGRVRPAAAARFSCSKQIEVCP